MTDYGQAYGILIDEVKHTYRDFGLICTSLQIELPELKKKQIELKGADGYIDLTEVFGHPMYGNRTIKAEFVLKETGAEDCDPAYYYEGRFEEEHEKEFRPFSKVILTADCKPYKKELADSTAEDWLWDTFSFEDGIIREYKNITVNGSYTLNIIGREQILVPIIYSTAPMTVTYNNKTYNLVTGKNYIYSIAIQPGDNLLAFKGTGTISVEYRGGKL